MLFNKESEQMKKNYVIKYYNEDGELETPKGWKTYGEGLGLEMFPVFMDTSISEFSQDEKYFESEEEALEALSEFFESEAYEKSRFNHTSNFTILTVYNKPLEIWF
jgi:hypothetical protein